MVAKKKEETYLDRFHFDVIPLPLSFVYLPAWFHLVGHPRKITAPDKTRETLSKGAYIYETFGKQMDKSNILEAERRRSLRISPLSSWKFPPLLNGYSSSGIIQTNN